MLFATGARQGTGHGRKDDLMTEMRERAKGFESQFTRDLDLQFRVYNRRNRLLGQWAAVPAGG